MKTNTHFSRYFDQMRIKAVELPGSRSARWAVWAPASCAVPSVGNSSVVKR